MPPGPSRLALLGTGLIGASLGLAVRRRHPEVEVVGTDANPSHVEAALAMGALSRAAASGPEAVAGADLVVLAAPLDAIPGLLREIGPHLVPGALVTDVGSVKGSVMRAAADALPEAVRVVGGHPMAGAAVGGPGSADALLFENAAYVLTPPRGVDDLAVYAPEALWLVAAVGARPVVMEADRHDVVAATVSHLPQLLAVALVAEAADAGPDALGLAAGGFRDMTRIAGSPFSMWGPILRDNAEAVTDVLDRFAGRLGALRARIDADPASVGRLFEASGRTRADLPTSSKGFLAPLADVVVWAEDRPGFLHALTGVIAEAGLNLKDAELLRIREGVTGTFRFGFATGPEADRAVAAFTEAGYRATRR
ncbi:MAG: prephenate dehydrogenase [Bacteroidota bacterium]